MCSNILFCFEFVQRVKNNISEIQHTLSSTNGSRQQDGGEHFSVVTVSYVACLLGQKWQYYAQVHILSRKLVCSRDIDLQQQKKKQQQQEKSILRECDEDELSEHLL